MKQTEIEILKKLVDDNAISFINANEKEYNKLYNEFIRMNGKPYIIGIDLASGPDRTVHSPHSKQQ